MLNPLKTIVTGFFLYTVIIGTMLGIPYLLNPKIYINIQSFDFVWMIMFGLLFSLVYSIHRDSLHTRFYKVKNKIMMKKSV